MMLEHLLVFWVPIFSTRTYGLIMSRNMVRVIMCLELILNVININSVIFSEFFYSWQLKGNIFSIFVIIIVTVEVAIGTTIMSLIYRKKKINAYQSINFVE
ncbi:hypothetical protein V6Z11_A12G062500 [Gossypium hirsutum]